MRNVHSKQTSNTKVRPSGTTRNVLPTIFEVAVDSIGPWTLTIAGVDYKFRALTMTDTVTALTELVRVNNATAEEAATQFEH